MPQHDEVAEHNEPHGGAYPIGRMAYEAYAACVGGKSVTGEPLRPWSFLSSDVMDGWKAAADAVLAEKTAPEAGESASRHPSPADMPKTSPWGGAWYGSEHTAKYLMYPPGS